jgi:threonine dehydrogenase-like Zn-dependent dehydrogenase
MTTHAPLPDPTSDEGDFYRQLTERNADDAAAQEALATATILVAGCGSIGGAAVEPLARLGARRFLLADPGEYEVNNLNRQNATLSDIGRNKAEVAAERVLAINPHASVRVFPEGVTADNVEELTTGCDIVVDGVDVTTMSGLRAKHVLHEQACRRRLPLLTGWDMLGAQYVRVYDYRRLRRVLDGRLSRDDLDRLSVWQVLHRLVPARYVPLEMVTLARANLTNPQFTFPQLVYAADLFGAVSSHVVAQVLAGRQVREHIFVDLHQEVRGSLGRARTRLERPLQVLAALASLHLPALAPKPKTRISTTPSTS